MEFFPLTLGLPKPRPIRPERDETELHLPRRARDEDAWRESLSAPPEEVEEFPEATVLARLRAGLPERPWVILGEPGAGKTRLLEHWHATWLRDLGSPRLGMAVPVLVRLRALAADTLRESPEVVADRLWHHALAAGQATARGCASSSVLDRPGRLVTPVWLLDGLDEVSGHPGDAALWDALGALPGAVVLTCRTVVYQQVQREVAGRHAPPWRILGLKAGEEQTEYLRRALDTDGKDPARAPGLIRALNANVALRPLAASPLLLSLVAEVCDTMALPANRAAFYTEATRTLWQRKLAGRPERALTAERDASLAAFAETMGVARIEADESALRQVAIAGPLREALRISGLLSFDERRERVSFPHLTFQEFHLARAWLARPLREMLDAHWADPRAEEAVALLLALHGADGRGAKVEATLQAFVSDWRERHRADPSVLWRIGRSPMRVALRLIGRAGVTLSDPLLGATDGPVPVRRTIARMSGLAPAALAALAKDADPDVRRRIAESVATPPEALVLLATDLDKEVRTLVAKNQSTPPATLIALAGDSDTSLRQWALRNAALSSETLTTLSLSTDPGIRGPIALNSATPPDIRAALARDPDAKIRRLVAFHEDTPPTILAALARDRDSSVRAFAAGNRATPPSILAELAKDAHADVRRRVAYNTATPREVLTALAPDPDSIVQQAVAYHPSSPPEALKKLSRDVVSPALERIPARWLLGSKPATPKDILSDLATTPHPFPRGMVALNENSSHEILTRLTEDPAPGVRLCVVHNTTTPPSLLARLATDPESDIRRCVAQNSATPPAALAALGRDRNADVRGAVGENIATPPETLAALGNDPVRHVRGQIAQNPSTPPETLAALAKAEDVDLRSGVILNPSALIEDLYRAYG